MREQELFGNHGKGSWVAKGMNDQKLQILSASIILWYPFSQGSRVLFVMESNEGILSLIGKRSCEAVAVSGERLKEGIHDVFDYVVCMSPPEKEEDPAAFLRQCAACLKPSGTILFPMNNRLGIRYFCGDRDPYSKDVCGGLIVRENASEKCRLYSKAEITHMLLRAGLKSHKFYSVLPGIDHPTHLFAHDYRPAEDIANRLYPAYFSPDTVFLEEEQLYRDLIDNDLFHSMANGFLIEAARDKDAPLSDALQITSSMDRNPDNAFFTIIHNDGTVTKENVYPEGELRFKQILKYAEDLKDHGIDVVEPTVIPKGISMPYVEAPTGQLALKEALLRDKEEFYRLMDAFRDCVLKSSETETDDVKLGPIAKHGYVDMVPLNSFYIDGRFVFFDQEFCIEHYPFNAILSRMIATFFFGNENLKSIVPMDEVYSRYGLLENRELWLKMEWEFLSPLRNEEALREYHQKVRRKDDLTLRNRERMNFPADKYISVFSEVFAGSGTKDIYVFGSGKYAEKFMDWYGPVLPVKGILDNDQDKWGKTLYGVQIMSPDALKSLPKDSYKVIICIKKYMPIIRQLDQMSISDYSVYDGRTVYPRKLDTVANGTEDETGDKPYHIGYISGTFDLFHKGHLNLLKRAKEQCDYLIVGVVSDEGVRKFKHVEPFIPFEERMEIVESCRYVDRAVQIPLEHRDIRSAYALYHFDCQFCGSDYYNDPVFMRDREWLRSRGSDLMILPYTESTSSTKIKRLIEQKLC